MKVCVLCTVEDSGVPHYDVYSIREDAVRALKNEICQYFMDEAGNFFEGCPRALQDEVTDLLKDVSEGFDVAWDFSGWDCSIGYLKFSQEFVL
jgi:hypothetical protein